MQLTGTLRNWHEDRGFGFIAPTGGGRELFVHISAFPRDGSRPAVGEKLSYETAPGKDGQLQAVRVTRQALGDPASYPARRLPLSTRRPARHSARPALGSRLIGAVLLLGLAWFGYSAFQRAAAPAQGLVDAADEPTAPAAGFRCDGRTHCSQMSSCAEARYFLRNCPGTQMDGNHDGEPCEQQWCTGP